MLCMHACKNWNASTLFTGNSEYFVLNKPYRSLFFVQQMRHNCSVRVHQLNERGKLVELFLNIVEAYV